MTAWVLLDHTQGLPSTQKWLVMFSFKMHLGLLMHQKGSLLPIKMCTVQ